MPFSTAGRTTIGVFPIAEELVEAQIDRAFGARAPRK
jgi:hypothetical protein